MSESIQEKLLAFEKAEESEEEPMEEEPMEEEPMEEVKVIKEKKKRPPMSEERKDKLRENLRKAREHKKKKKEMIIKEKENDKVKKEIENKEFSKFTLQDKIKKPKKQKLLVIDEEEDINPIPLYVAPSLKKITNLTNKKKDIKYIYNGVIFDITI